MTKKDYITIAEVLKNSFRMIEKMDLVLDDKSMIKDILITSTCYHVGLSNPTFDSIKFLKYIEKGGQ